MKHRPLMSAALIALATLTSHACAQAPRLPVRVAFDISSHTSEQRDHLREFNEFPSHFEADFAVAVLDSNGNGTMDKLWRNVPHLDDLGFPGTATNFGRHIGSPEIRSTISPAPSGFCGGGASMVMAFKSIGPPDGPREWYMFWLAFHENPTGLSPGCSPYPIDCGIATWHEHSTTRMRSNFHAATLVSDSGTGFTQHGPISLLWTAAGWMNNPGAVLTADPANPACVPGPLPSITVGEFYGAGTSHLRFNLTSLLMDVPYVSEDWWAGDYFYSDRVTTRTFCGQSPQVNLPAGPGGNPASRRLLITKGIAVPGFGDNTILTPYDSQGSNWSYFIGGGQTARGYGPAPDGTGRLLVGQVGSAGVWALNSGGAITDRVRLSPLANFYPTSYQQQESFGHVLWTRSLPGSGLAEVWKVSNAGVTLSRTNYAKDAPGFTAEAFQILADGTGKLVWTDSAGHADIWTLDRAGAVVSRKAVTGPPLSQARSYEKLADGTARILWSRTVNGNIYSVSTLDSSDNAVSRTPDIRLPSLTWAASLSMY